MRAPIRGLVITGLLTARFGLCHGQVAEFLPTDQGPTDSAFKAFRSSLRRAVSQFDTGFVMSVLSPEVTTGFDSPAGPEAFHKTWFERSPSPNLWEVLGTILVLGGAFRSDSVFMAPYVTATWPGRFDSFEHVAVVGRHVRVRRRPTREARVLETVSYQILRIRGYGPIPDESGARESWIRVYLRDGREGYVAQSYVRSPIDYRVAFTRRGGRWLLSWIGIGD
jgi:hypothetical protein